MKVAYLYLTKHPFHIALKKMRAGVKAYNAANNIPDLLSALISGGALGVALIPVLSEYLETKGRPDAWALFARILNLAFLVTGGLAILIAIFAEPFVARIIAPGFPPEQKDLTVELMRLDLAAIMIFSLSGLVMAGLQANQHFTLPAMAPVLYNVGQIFGVMILSPETGFRLGPERAGNNCRVGDRGASKGHCRGPRIALRFPASGVDGEGV